MKKAYGLENRVMNATAFTKVQYILMVKRRKKVFFLDHLVGLHYNN